MNSALAVKSTSALLLGALLFPAEAHTNWPAAGVPVASGPGTQTFSTLVPDDAGGAFVLWSSGSGIPGSMQRITSNGDVAPGWPSSGMALSTHVLMGAARDGTGGIFIVRSGPRWVDYGPAWSYGRRVYAWHYGPTGALVASWPDSGRVVWSEQYSLNDDYGLQRVELRGIYPDGSGGVDLALRWERAFANAGYHFVHVSPTGTATTRELWLDPMTGALALAPDGFGGLVAMRSGENNVEAFRYSGQSGFTPSRVLATGSFMGAEINVFRLSPGSDMLLSWHEQNESEPMVLRTDTMLRTSPGWSDPGVRTPFAPLACDEQGGAFAKFWSGPPWRIQRLDASGAPPTGLWPPGQLPAQTSGALVADALGGCFQTQVTSNYPDPQATLRAFHIGPDGATSPWWPVDGRVISALAYEGYSAPVFSGQPRAERTAPGAVFLGWTEIRGADSDVYVQKLFDDDPVPTAVLLASFHLLADRVILDWRLSEPGADLIVERRQGDGEWIALGHAALVERDTWRFEDCTVRKGDVLAYRLVDGGSALPGSQLLVTVPAPQGLTLRGFVTNPATRDADLEFALPDSRPARLELLDVSGRVLARRDVGALGPGTHRVTLAEGVASSPGLVFIRLVQGEQARTARAVIRR